MTYGGGPGDPFGGAPFGQQHYSGPPIISAPAPQHQPGEVNTFATLSVVFAFLFAPAGAVLGHLGLAQIRRTGQRGRDRALIGVILSYVFIVVAVVALVIWAVMPSSASPSAGGSADTAAPTPTPAPAQTATSTPTTTTQAELPLVTQAQLPGLLLSLEDVKRVANAPNDYTSKDTEQLNSSDGMTATPPQCPTTLISGADEIYGQSGMVATLGRNIDYVKPKNGLGVAILEERAVLYDNAAAADRQVDAIAEVWRSCAGVMTVQPHNGGASSSYNIEAMTRAVGNPSMILLKVTMPGYPGYNLRAVAAKANVVVDVSVFGADLGDGAEAIAATVMSRIGG